jgi:electron transfer flavoprotein beta subunit
MVLNAYDASAVESALVLAAEHGGSIQCVLIGPDGARETIRKALAMGADEAIHVRHDAAESLDSHAVAAVLASTLRGLAFDVVLCGKQSQDSDSGLAGGMLAEHLGLPYTSNAVGLAVDNGRMVVTRQGDSGQEIVELPTPCLVTCSNDMNDPRIPNLKGIMAAKKKPVNVIEDAASVESHTQVLAIEAVPPREPGVMLDGDGDELVTALVDRLVNEAKVV